MVPNGWQKTDLSNFINIKHGFAFKSEYFSDSGNYILLTPGSFYETGGYRDQGAKTKYYIGEIPESYLLTKGELLVAMTEQAAGLLGSTMFVPESNIYLHNQRLGKIVIEAHEQIDKEFLYLTFNAPHTRRQISSQSTGTKVKHTSPDKLKSVVCLLPPIGEQRKIAKILSTWDKAISTTARLIDNSKQQKKALMQQLLTGKKRLLDDSGKPFEGEWEEVKLGDAVSTGRGFAFKSTQYSDSGYKIVRVTNIDSSGKIDLSDCVYIPDETACEYKKYELLENDILLVMVGATAGKLGFVSENTLPALLNQNMWSLRAKNKSQICQIFLRHVIYRVVAKYLLSQQGSARGFFTQKTFESVKFSIPSIREQQKIAAVLTNSDKEIELLEQQLADLNQEKKALMQQLLTGKRRVQVDDEAVA